MRLRPVHLLFFLVLTACGAENKESSEPTRFVAFGDSNTRALGTSGRWVNQINSTAINFAEDGTTSSRHRDLITGMVAPSSHISILYMSGYNDMRYFGLAGVPAYKENLRAIFSHLRANKIYAGNCLRMPVEGYQFDAMEMGHGGQDDSVAVAYSAALTEVAADFDNVTLVDVNSLDPSLDYFYDDYRHLNERGHDRVAKLFLAQLALN